MVVWWVPSYLPNSKPEPNYFIPTLAKPYQAGLTQSPNCSSYHQYASLALLNKNNIFIDAVLSVNKFLKKKTNYMQI